MNEPHPQRHPAPHPGAPVPAGRPVPPGLPGHGGHAGRPGQPGRAARRSAPAEIFAGVGYLLRGLGWVARRPKQWLFGLIPATIVLAVYGTGLVLLALQADDLAAWLTPFADDWSEDARRVVRLVAGLALVGAAGFLSILTFTALTLLVGDPFYEAIAVRVEESQGGAPPDPEVPLLTSLWRSFKDSVVLGVVAVIFAATFFVLSFIPVLGQTVVPVVAACVSGYFLTGALGSFALGRRNIRRKERYARLRRNRPLAIGFGAATVAIFLIPLGAVLAMPGAVAGATLLARERLADQDVVTLGKY